MSPRPVVDLAEWERATVWTNVDGMRAMVAALREARRTIHNISQVFPLKESGDEILARHGIIDSAQEKKP